MTPPKAPLKKQHEGPKTPLMDPLTLTLTLIKTEYWDPAGGGGNINYNW